LSIGFHKTFLSDNDKKIVRNAIQYATDAKVIIFAASSNEGNRQDILFPAGEWAPFCINSSNGNGITSDFNPPARLQTERFTILGENVKSAWLQRPRQSKNETDVSPVPASAVRTGTSVATPIAASVGALIILFARQWEPKGHEVLEDRQGMYFILNDMAVAESSGFNDIIPWHGVFGLSLTDLTDPVAATIERFEKKLREY
jgi:hypothetical protein